ncbi:MAG: ribonuclease R [Bacteroidetes bacterium]|nr:ribonuclease R [Bacteroidota bacterium]
MKNKKNSNATTATLKGTLEITRSGIGYVVIANGTGDVIVRPNDFNRALNGDTVRVKVTKENLRTNRKEGIIIDIVERKQIDFIGHIQINPKHAFFVADTNKSMPDFYIPLDKINGAIDKQKVVARLTRWEKDDKKPIGEIIEVIKAEDESNFAMKEILTENGFPLSFPDEVMTEANALPETLDEIEIANRIDFRETLTFTIDPTDAKDFDDAISIKKIKNDLYEIGVHIADVSHYVLPNTKLDEEAYKRATSVYLPDRVNPMLPEKISNELCSLRPHEDKFTFSAIFEINTKAEVKKTTLCKTVIHSNHRYSYEDVQEIIEGRDESNEYKEEVLLLNKISQTLRKQRFSKGAINFSSKEVRFQLDETGKPIAVIIKESKEAHQLIEELMLLANKAVAHFVANKKFKNADIPFPYRVHDTPDETKLAPFIAFAKKYGHKFDTSSPEKVATSFNQLLDDARGKPEQQVLETLGIRTMAKATYTTSNIGHYGLAFEYYAHFTSPIRRYPDVLVHRVLQSILQDKIIIDDKMEEKCVHCSLMERAAMDSERAGNKYKQVEFMRDKLGQTFEGVISGVAAFGFWVETLEHKCEGLVSITTLSDYDDFRLVETDYSLVGKRSGRKFKMGDKINILVVAANLDKRQLDYEWVLEKSK